MENGLFTFTEVGDNCKFIPHLFNILKSLMLYLCKFCLIGELFTQTRIKFFVPEGSCTMHSIIMEFETKKERGKKAKDSSKHTINSRDSAKTEC